MTIKKFFVIFLLQLVLLTVLKYFLYSFFDYQNFFWGLVYCVATAAIVVLLVRRLGVINFLEAIFVAVFWFLFDLLADALVTWPLTGTAIFFSGALWVGYLVLMLTVFAAHNKRHIQIRNEQAAAHHHGHH